MSPERRARWLLAAGAVAGLTVAVATLVQGRDGRSLLAGDSVAQVNDVSIPREDYLRALGAVAADRRASITDDDRRHVLDRLIDEELLLQRGLALQITRHDRTVRGQIVSATIDLLGRSTSDPSQDELRAFHAAHRDYFTEGGRLRVRQILVRVAGRSEGEAQGRAGDAARRLRDGEGFDAVRAALGDDEVAPIPDTLLPAAKLREYVGETATAAALACASGDVTQPIRSSMGFHVLQVTDRAEPTEPPFEEIVDRVRAEYRRRADDGRLRIVLDDLRRTARIRFADPLP